MLPGDLISSKHIGGSPSFPLSTLASYNVQLLEMPLAEACKMEALGNK